MSEQPKWTTGEESACIGKWTDYLQQSKTTIFSGWNTWQHVVFVYQGGRPCFCGFSFPPNIDQDQLNAAISDAVNQHNLYGVIFIGEIWMYVIKEKDHTAFQLLDGEMKVSDLRDGDKREALMVRMESRDGDSLIYLDEIIRNDNGIILKEGRVNKSAQMNWFKGINTPGE